jgi:chlorobactene glucosyltransferase
MGVGLYIARAVHSRSNLDIVVDPARDGELPLTAEKPPLISVLVPARNEERNIRRCLLALSIQTYPNYELIVVDDRSDDETPEILAEITRSEPRLRILPGVELPAGWTGKPHALVQGAAAARGEWLCFIDADTFAEPGLLASAYQVATRYGADMFSILTEQEMFTFWERTILPLVFLGLSYGFPAQRVNDPAKPDAISNGQFILIRRHVYEHVGGHTSVKDRVDEDKAIAQVVKRAGYRLLLADGRKVARTRMYTSLPEMWEGWTKSIYIGLRDRLWLLLFGVLLGVMVSIGFPLWLFGGVVWLAIGGGLTAAFVTLEAAVLWAYVLWERLRVSKSFGIPPGYAFTFPLGAFLFTLMMLASAFKVISGRGVSWKGRRYR